MPPTKAKPICAERRNNAAASKRPRKNGHLRSQTQQNEAAPNELELNLLQQAIEELVNINLTAHQEPKFQTYADLEQFTSEELIRIHHDSLTSRISDQQMEYAESLVKTLNEYPGSLAGQVRPNTRYPARAEERRCSA